MRLVSVYCLALLVWAQYALAGCELTAQHWQAIQTGFSSPDFYEYFKDEGHCSSSNAAGLLASYSDCTDSLEVVLVNRSLSNNCRANVNEAMYRDNGVLKEADILTLSIDICTKPLGSLIGSYLCDPTNVPGCPRPAEVGKFAAMISCIGVNKPDAERTAYFNNGDDKTCMKRLDFCAAFNGFQTCLTSVNDIMDFIYTTDQEDCPDLYRAHPDQEARCAQSLRDMYLFYCPKQSIFEQNLLAFAVGIPAGVIGLCVFIYCCVKLRSGYISENEIMVGVHDDQELKRRDSAQKNLSQTFHPEFAAVMEKKSKYKGITYDINAKMWRSNTTGQLFVNEMDAAQAAYFAQVNAASPRARGNPMLATQSSSPILTQQSSFGSMSPIIAAYNEPMIPTETDEEKRARRIKQLINFYEYWDADKPDIPGHTENLIKRHDFTYVARAVKTKYGLLPPGWEEELEADAI